MTPTILAWAHCPNCDRSRRGGRQYGRQIRVSANDTHRRLKAYPCPDCGDVVQMRVSSPVVGV